MTQPMKILAIALSGCPPPQKDFTISKPIWLTLYLGGGRQSFENARDALVLQGWGNLENNGEFAGFAYPKKCILNDSAQVRRSLQPALSVCATSGMAILQIDAETKIDPEETVFHTLYCRT